MQFGKIFYGLFLAAVGLICVACGGGKRAADQTERAEIWVSILPLKGVVSAIVGDDFTVRVLVPAGASPESFEPTARQLVELNQARMLFGVGLLDFEQNLLSKLGEQCRVENLSQGIAVEAGSCSCNHRGAHHHHAHGVDPHVWTSPRELQQIARNAYRAIHAAYPDSLHYTVNYEALAARIEQVDRAVAEQIKESGVQEFMIYHPALTYYARAYSIEQLPIEHEGKEPSARRMAELIDRARLSGCRNVLYQSQFPGSSVQIIADDLGGKAVAFDPLAEDILGEIERVTKLITNR